MTSPSGMVTTSLFLGRVAPGIFGSALAVKLLPTSTVRLRFNNLLIFMSWDVFRECLIDLCNTSPE